MTSRALYKESVSHDLTRIAPKDRERVLRQISEVLGVDPRGGEPLHGEFAGLFKPRVGDYRVIYPMTGSETLVLRIRHRGNAYG